jgi:hypothetical protein
VSHTTIHRWVIRYAPEFEKRWNRFARPVNTSWGVGETHISIRGKWNYLYRAVDKHGKTVDFLLRPDRGIAAAQAPAVGLPQEQSGILQALAAAANDGMEEVSVGDAGKMTGLTATVFKYHAAELEDADYIYIGRDMTGTYCRITPKGSGWLIKNKLMPD